VKHTARITARAAVALVLGLGEIAAGPVATAAAPTNPAGVLPPEARVERVLAQWPLVDGHNDLPWQLRSCYGGVAGVDLALDQSHAPKPASASADCDWATPMTDLPRLRAGHVGGQFWSVWIPPEVTGPAAVKQAIEQIDVVHEMVARYPDTLQMALTAEDIVAAHKAGRVASLIGIEGGAMIDNSLAVLRQYQALGARYLTLTHTRATDWADSATENPRHHGLAPFGVEVVHELNRLGMLVDLSHVSPETMQAALAASRAPVIFSHSGARAIDDHPRNVPDAVLAKVRANHGLVMVNFNPGYVSRARARWDADRAAEQARNNSPPYNGLYVGQPERAAAALAEWERAHPAPAVTLAMVADHIEHIREVAGIDCVGLGSDFDGISAVPVGLEGVDRFPALLAELARRGWSDADLGKVAGGNLLRVMREAEAVARRMQAERRAVVATVHDLVVRNGMVYDGLGGEPYMGEVAIDGDRIAYVGAASGLRARRVIDAHGQAVAPGFINMLAHPEESFFADGRALSDLAQGVTLEVIGEDSMGPLNARMKQELVAHQRDIHYAVTWSTFGGYLEMLEKRGIAPNVASFVGAPALRSYVLGEGDVQPTAAQLLRMQQLARQAMEEGALGITTMLIYAPAAYARTPELIALAQEAARCGGPYTAHMRSEGDGIEAALDETISIARSSGAPAEIYHLKLAGQDNWGKLDAVISRIEAARASGTRISANMYTYLAGATGLDAAMPTWVQAGGLDAWIARLKDPATRMRVLAEMRLPHPAWENLMGKAGAEGTLLLGFKTAALKPLTGKTLAEVARQRGTSPEDTAIDLVIEDGSRIEVAYFLMSEDNVRRQVALPWMSFGSDEGAPSPEGAFLLSMPHPRAYGNFARLFAEYVRTQKLLTVQEAVRRLTSLPASNLALADRGRLAAGAYADVVVFDPATIQDHATYDKPHQLATGVSQVIVNGRFALADGQPTGAPSGRAVRGRAWKGYPDGGCRAKASDWSWAP
jgi:N-acyl-D-amino-acid deacylase